MANRRGWSRSFAGPVAIFAALASGIVAAPAPGRAEPPQGDRGAAPAEERYRADFSESSSRGIGVRFAHLPSGRHVDLRLKGYRGREPSMRGRAARFDAAPGVKVVYEPDRNQVKETIVLDQPSPAQFRFTVEAPGLAVREEAGEIVVGGPGDRATFRLRRPVAWDARGADIPATLRLEQSEAVLQLDPAALAQARPPIVIDPTIEGAPDGATEGPNARKLFQTADGRLVFFYVSWTYTPTQVARVVYRVSADGGATWGAPVTLAEASWLADVAATQGPGDTFWVTYLRWTPTPTLASATTIVLRELTLQADGTWAAGPERTVAGPGAVWGTTVADRGAGPLGRRLAAGFSRYNDALFRYEYAASFSEDSGQTWTLPTGCVPGDRFEVGGAVAAQGDSVVCVGRISTAENLTPGLHWARWTGVAWSPARPIAGVPPYGWRSPSMVVSDGGTIHLVAEARPDCCTSWTEETYYTSLAPGAADWAQATKLGPGAAPVIATTGTSLHAYATQRLSGRESWIRQYVAPDGVTWAPGLPLSGLPFTYVLDYNAAWAFEDLPGDALFAVADGAGDPVGNRIGTALIPHRLDALTKKLSFSFVPGQGGQVSLLRLWITAQASPPYRIGLQSDAAGVPSGTWLNEVRVGGAVVGGAFADVTPPDGTLALSVPIPDTALAGGQRYHLAVEPKPPATALDPVPGPTNWVEAQAVGTDAGAEGSYRVIDDAGAGWQVAPAQVPRVWVGAGSAPLVAQEITPGAPQPINEYSVPAESFVAPRTMAPTSIRAYLKKVGAPAGSVTLRLLDSGGTELWFGEGTPQDEGWLDLPLTGVSLTAGARYRLIADARDVDLSNHWALAVSGNDSVSWDGSASRLTMSPDRTGFNDRSIEADDQKNAPVDFVAFNSSAQDALYLGALERFNFATLSRAWTDPGNSVGTAWSYWNGSGWASLPMTQNEFGTWGDAEFTPPTDWMRTDVHGRDAYWVKVVSTAPAPTPIFVQRASSIRNFRSPTVAPRASGGIPVAWASTSAGSTQIQVEQAPTAPDLFKDLRGDFPGILDLPSTLTWTPITGMSVTTPMRQGSTHFVRGIASGHAIKIGGGTASGTVKVLQGTRVECGRSDQPPSASRLGRTRARRTT